MNTTLFAMLAAWLPVLTLDEANVRTWRARIEPTAAERRWSAIPWRTQFLPAMREADRRGMPVLMWGMNGHPLGCT